MRPTKASIDGKLPPLPFTAGSLSGRLPHSAVRLLARRPQPLYNGQQMRPNRADGMSDELKGHAVQSAAMRERAEAEMKALGIDEAFIGKLVDTFYARVLAHPELGPVFDARLSGRWPEHMEKMKSFWSAVAFRSGAYGGKPVQAHLGVANMSPELFPKWLGLFAATLDDIAPNEEAKAWFMATAERIARSLTLSLFYNPALDDPALKRS
ncbi:Globin-like protein [Sinorhizobium meliloti SM11]|nr:Globin-like protein [Sinorhizobium meliloti SM11]